MNKIVKKILVATLIFGATSITAMAAIPNFTAVVGKSAFDLEYLNLKASNEDNEIIRKHVVSGEEIYVKMLNGSWVANSTGKSINTNVLPEVSYKDANGNESTYGAQDGNEITKNEFKVISIE